MPSKTLNATHSLKIFNRSCHPYLKNTRTNLDGGKPAKAGNPIAAVVYDLPPRPSFSKSPSSVTTVFSISVVGERLRKASREISLDPPAGWEVRVSGTVEPEREYLTFGSSSDGTGVKTPEQQRLSRREMQTTCVSGFKHADTSSSEQGETISVRVRVGKTSFKMSWLRREVKAGDQQQK